MPKLIICAGIQRSGSTWVYNATRLLLAASYPGSVYGCWIADYNKQRPETYHVVKIHEPNPLATSATAILTSRRDLRDIAASLWIRRWVKSDREALEIIGQAVKFHSYWLTHRALDIPYDSVSHTPLQVIDKIAAHIGLGSSNPVDSSIVLAQIEALPDTTPGERPYDPTTLLHEKHRMHGGHGYFKDVLSPALVAELETRFGTWLRTYGYMV